MATLTPELAKELQSTLLSQGWTRVIEPYLKQLLMVDLELLSAPIRPEHERDDLIRGRIERERTVLSVFQGMLMEYQANLDATKREELPPAAGSPYAKGANLPEKTEQ